MVEERREAFLERWSRRKRDAGMEKRDFQEERADVPAAMPSEQDDEAERKELEANRLAAEAVDIDALGKGDDFTVFFKRGVPRALRSKALRKLWRTNPVLANLDGLNDYDTDFNAPAANRYVSLWQAGQGYLSRERDHDGAAAEQKAGVPTTDDDESAVEAHLAETPVAQGQGEPDDVDEASVAAGEDSVAEEAAVPTRRRVSIRQRLQG